MNIDVTTAQANPSVRIVHLSGRLDGTTSDAAAPTIMDALTQSGAGIIINLAGVDFISSAGLRVVLLLRKKAETDGKRLALIAAQPPIYKIFKISELDKLLHFFEDEAQAIRALWP